MSRFKIRTAMMGAMALLALGAFSFTARAADPLKLESIDVQTLSGQQVQLKLHMSGPAPEPLPYTTKVDGNNIIVTLGSQPGDVAKQAAVVARAGSGQGGAAVDRAIRTIDFRRGADGTGRVIVQLTDPRTPVNVRQEANQIVVDFAGTVMPKNLMRRYDVMDFATPVQTVDALRVEGSSRLVISAQGDFEQLAYQSDNQYT